MTDIDKLAVEVTGVVQQESADNIITLSTGVVLRIKPVSSMIFTELSKRHPQPKVPMWFNKENDRNEPNPNNPDYVEDMRNWQMNVGIGVVDIMIIMGTQFVSVTGDAPRLDDEEWIDNLVFTGMNIDRDNRRARYLAYIKYVAAVSDEDMEKLMQRVSGQSGVSEADVDSAVSQFRDKK